MKLETILVGVDFSDSSQIAVEHAANLARKTDAKLVLLHVASIPSAPIEVPDAIQPTRAEYQRLIEDHLAEDRRRLQELRERIAGQDTRVSHMIIDGFPDEGITQAADQVDADLVVMGSHGRTGLKRMLIGSVAEKVVRISKRSVLVARAIPGMAAGGYRKILVATDFSASAEHALATAMELAARDAQPDARPSARPSARIDIVHAWHLPPISYSYGPAPRIAVELAEPLAEHAKERGAELIERYDRPGVKLRFHLAEAAPIQGILERLDQGDYDLVVTGSHGRRGIRRFLLGSVAEATVRHATIPVLVTHGPLEESSLSGEQSP